MNMSLAVLGLSGGELIVVLVVILVLFGAKRIPEFAKGLGKGISEFKKASSEVTNEIQQAMDTPVQPAKPAQPVQQAQTSVEAPKDVNHAAPAKS